MASREILTELALRLGAAEERLDVGAEKTRVAVRRARVRVEGLLGEPPVGGGLAGRTPLEHLDECCEVFRPTAP